MSKVTAGINRINQELDKISGMDGIAADKIAELETYVKEMVSDLLEYHSEANVFNYDGNNCCKEKSVKELDKQIQKEHCIINHLYAQINAYERSLERLKNEREAAIKREDEAYIDEWFNIRFGISNQQEARTKSIHIVFDENGNFVKTVTTGYDEEFHYVSPVEDEDTMEHWLRENKLYAHRASSFCDRNRSWYSLPLKEQLKNIGWDFDETGKLIKTQW